MAQPPLISIIVNNYNYGRFLRIAIESALVQVYQHVEVIVVDDGSTDDSRTIIASFGERVVAVLKENGGQASAFNAGFAACHGELVIFLDADDVLMPLAATHAAEALHRFPDAAMIMCRMAVVDAAGRKTGALKPAPHLTVLSGDLRRHVLAFPDDVPWLPTSGNTFAATVLRQIMPMPEVEYRILADFYLSHLAPLFGLVVALPEVGAYYRVHGSNNYEVTRINLVNVRRTIIHWRQTHQHIRHFAGALGLVDPSTLPEILSVAYVANRMISLKLDPTQHPILEDSVWAAARDGIRAVGRRFDIALRLKGVFVVWFMVMVVIPRPIALSLAETFLFPAQSRLVSRVLQLLGHYPSDKTT
jgi:hypothetical protein